MDETKLTTGNPGLNGETLPSFGGVSLPLDGSFDAAAPFSFPPNFTLEVYAKGIGEAEDVEPGVVEDTFEPWTVADAQMAFMIAKLEAQNDR